MQNILEEILKLKEYLEENQGSDTADQVLQLKKLRYRFKEVAMEVFKKMYGFYNTDTNVGLDGMAGNM